jgi:hypothetical protein
MGDKNKNNNNNIMARLQRPAVRLKKIIENKNIKNIRRPKNKVTYNQFKTVSTKQV